jgi:hypothetical protein
MRRRGSVRGGIPGGRRCGPRSTAAFQFNVSCWKQSTTQLGQLPALPLLVCDGNQHEEAGAPAVGPRHGAVAEGRGRGERHAGGCNGRREAGRGQPGRLEVVRTKPPQRRSLTTAPSQTKPSIGADRWNLRNLRWKWGSETSDEAVPALAGDVLHVHHRRQRRSRATRYWRPTLPLIFRNGMDRYAR